MKIKKGFVLEKVADSYLACATGKLTSSFSGFVRMNESGAFLWSVLEKDDVDETALSARLMSEYGIDEALAKSDVAAFIKNLEKNGILEG